MILEEGLPSYLHGDLRSFPPIGPGRTTLGSKKIRRPDPVACASQAIPISVKHDRPVGNRTCHAHHFRVKENRASLSPLSEPHRNSLVNGAVGDLGISPHINRAGEDASEL